MRVLIVGATGFIGKHLTRALSKKKYIVRSLVRRDSKKEDINFLKSCNAEIFVGDVFDKQSLLNAMKGADAVFNLVGGGYISTTFKKGYENLRKYNVGSLKIIMEIAIKAKIKKLVHFSSISAMGIVTERELDENSECFPKTPHEICKLEAEKIAEEFKDKIWITIIRPGIVFGPYGMNSEVLQLSKIMKKHFFIIPGDGENIMPWVYIEDVVSASILAFEKNKKSCEKFIIISSPEPTFNNFINSIRKNLDTFVFIVHIPKFLFLAMSYILERLGEIFGFEPLINSTRAKSMTSNRIYSIKKIKNLGYSQGKSFEQEIKQTIGWYKENGCL